MTTHRSYTCNVCRESIVAREEGIGLYFSNQDEQGRYQADIRFHRRLLHECETHLCTKCLRALLALVQRVSSLHVIA